jgi:hypothetical protein
MIIKSEYYLRNRYFLNFLTIKNQQIFLISTITFSVNSFSIFSSSPLPTPLYMVYALKHNAIYMVYRLTTCPSNSQTGWRYKKGFGDEG